MTFKTCPSCGGDLSVAPVKKKLFSQFLMKVLRCPHCRQRTTFLTHRALVGIKPAQGLRNVLE
jgi:hypothetical protein